MKKLTYQNVFNFESMLFGLFLVGSIIPFFLVRYVASLDGPQHLHNARLIVELIKGNEYLAEYFSFNPVIVGNLSSLYILAALLFIFPAWLAEKIFLSLSIIGLALSFRYFIRSMQKPASNLYLLIFPFGFTSLFMMGYYNFSLAFIPFFLSLGYIRKHGASMDLRKLVILFLLILLIYLSHALVVAFFGFIIALHMILDAVFLLIRNPDKWKAWFTLIRKYLAILIAAIPTLILWGIYYLSIKTRGQYDSSLAYKPIHEILKDLATLRILVGFHTRQELGPDLIIFICMTVLILLSFFPPHRYFPRIEATRKKIDADWLKWLITSIFFFLLTLFFPDRLITGSMTARLSVLFFLSVIAWIGIQSIPKKIVSIAMVIILLAFTWHRIVVHKYYNNMDREIKDLDHTAKYIDPNTILFPVNCSENWSQLHFDCYLGVDKALVNLGNPQPGSGQLPLVWNTKKLPEIRLGRWNNKELGIDWVSGKFSSDTLTAEYIFFWRRQRLEEVEGAKAFMEKVNPYYTENQEAKTKNGILLTLNNN